MPAPHGRFPNVQESQGGGFALAGILEPRWVVEGGLAAAVYIAVYQLIGLVQCFLVIGLARIVFTLAYIRTKNILVCFGAHLLTDWGIFTASLVLT